MLERVHRKRQPGSARASQVLEVRLGEHSRLFAACGHQLHRQLDVEGVTVCVTEVLLHLWLILRRGCTPAHLTAMSNGTIDHPWTVMFLPC